MADAQPILECENLSISYFTRQGEIPAVVDFNLKVMPGEAVGVVGESGCGKSTVALAIMCYLGKNGRIVKGSLKFKGRDMTTMSEEELRQLRGSEIAMVYQEPMASLNPSLTDRPAADGGAALPRAGERGGGARAGGQDAGRGQAARPAADHELLPAPDLGRPAAARGDRHGAAVQPGAADPGRADDGARRHGRGRHRDADQGDRRPVRHLDDLHLAQSRPDPRDLRPDHGHVFGRGGRERDGGRGLRPDAPPLHARPVQLDPAAGCRQERAAAGADPRPAAAAAPAAAGLLVRAALRLFRAGRSATAGHAGHGDGRSGDGPWRALPALARDRLGGGASRCASRPSRRRWARWCSRSTG